MSRKTALLLLAEGSEELEAVGVINVLRRADVKVVVAAVSQTSPIVKCSQRTQIQHSYDAPKSQFADAEYDVVVIPGGLPGTKCIHKDKLAGTVIRKQYDQGKLVAGICAAPSIVLQPLGIIDGKKVCGYPADVLPLDKANTLDAPVVIHGNVITSQGPATNIIFGLAILRELLGEETAKKVASGMLFRHEIEFPKIQKF